MIHPSAIIHAGARIAPDVEVGPYVVIDANVSIGPGCKLGPHVYVTGHTTLGANNHLHAGCVIGDAPQDLKYKDAPTRVCIGDNNVFREHVTVHRSNKVEEDTVIGSNNFLMANSHVGHNSVIGNSVIMANGCLLGGHVVIEDKAFVSGNCLIHQFARVGMRAMMQGGSAISKDLPPFAVSRGINGMCGLNVVGMRRDGYTSEQRQELKRLYHLLFRSEGLMRDLLERARQEFSGELCLRMINFVATSRRGIVRDTGRSGGAGEEAE